MKRTKTVERIDPRWLNRQIGVKLRRLRHGRGLTTEEVSIAMGVTRAAVTNWELGKAQSGFLLERLYNLALFYRIHVRQLLP